MPLLSPTQIHAVLKETKPQVDNDASLKDLLAQNNLSPSEVLDSLTGIMRAGETDSVRLRAAEVALKLNGMLNDKEGVQIPHVTIVINNGDLSSTEINPILIPR